MWNTFDVLCGICALLQSAMEHLEIPARCNNMCISATTVNYNKSVNLELTNSKETFWNVVLDLSLSTVSHSSYQILFIFQVKCLFNLTINSRYFVQRGHLYQRTRTQVKASKTAKAYNSLFQSIEHNNFINTYASYFLSASPWMLGNNVWVQNREERDDHDVSSWVSLGYTRTS